ncbi:MAG TPA: respiratory nitrate reductase subunit gamma [Polyangia bacterium]|nr:respiratory nitrate reductase subunit gamma [Polyangia bacterium]
MNATDSPSPASSLFHAWPLVALAVCAAGLVVRALAMRDGVHAARLAFHRARRVFWGGRPLTAALLLLLAGHLLGLLFPRAILAWNRAPARLYLLEGAAFGIGLAALAAWLRAARRHLGRTDAPLVVELADALFLAMTFLAIASGLGMATLHRWASSWGVATLRPYALSIFAGDPRGALVAQLPFLVRMHVFTTFAALAVFPPTRLAPLPILLVARAAAACGRPVAAAARAGGAALWSRCAALLWNEPQVRWRIKPAVPAEAAAAPPGGKEGRPVRPSLPRPSLGERALFSPAGEGSIGKART